MLLLQFLTRRAAPSLRRMSVKLIWFRLSPVAISLNPVRILRECMGVANEDQAFLKFLTIPDSQASQKGGKYAFGQIQ